MENWYPYLKDYTFRTEFLELPVESAKAFLKYRENSNFINHYKRMRKPNDPNVEIPPIVTGVSRCTHILTSTYLSNILHLPLLTEQRDAELVEEWTHKLDEVIKQFDGAFVRLSTRSPKDRALSSTFFSLLFFLHLFCWMLTVGRKMREIVAEEIKPSLNLAPDSEEALV